MLPLRRGDNKGDGRFFLLPLPCVGVANVDVFSQRWKRREKEMKKAGKMRQDKLLFHNSSFLIHIYIADFVGTGQYLSSNGS